MRSHFAFQEAPDTNDGADHVARRLAANSVQSRQINLFDFQSEASLYHDISQFGWFSILHKPHDSDKKLQRSYKLPDMPEVLRLLPKDRDTWLSQAEFTTFNRRVINLARISLLFVDIDCYKLDIKPEYALEEVCRICGEMNFPQPSVSINSGRGLQLKWLHKPIPRYALPRWNLAQSKLVELFIHLGADAGAKDASRVLRLVSTVNTKSNKTVEVIACTLDSEGLPVVHGFDYLAEFLTDKGREHFDKKLQNHPFSQEEMDSMATKRIKREQLKASKGGHLSVIDGGKKASGRSQFSSRSLAWHRMDDIRKLVEIRGGVKAGQSMTTLFWSLNFLLLSGATNSAQMYFEAQALCTEFGFGLLNRKDELGMLYQRAKEFEAGKMVCWNGRELPALYTPRNQSLIDAFEITSDEMKMMRTIITPDEKKVRRTDKRRIAGRSESKHGEVPREVYLSNIANQREVARSMRSAGRKQREIAEELNVSIRTVKYWVK